MATVAFYTALHYVEAWFAIQGRGMHFESHEKRHTEMGKVKEFAPDYLASVSRARNSKPARQVSVSYAR
jgi:hypothetical protein